MTPAQPPKAAKEMFAGLVGDVVKAYAPYTEASAVSVASQFVVAFGNAAGRDPHFYLGATRHGANEYLAVVGRTSVGRKGDGEKVAMDALGAADNPWLDASGPGLSSGEGLIHAVRDPVYEVARRGKVRGSGCSRIRASATNASSPSSPSFRAS
jgi:hypothetical protein